MARFTPKQKPALSATITSMWFPYPPLERGDRIHDATGKRVLGLSVPRHVHRRTERRAETNPDEFEPRDGSADVVRTGDTDRQHRSPCHRGEPADSGTRRKHGPALVAGAFREDEQRSPPIQRFLPAAEPRPCLSPSLKRDRIIPPEHRPEHLILEQFRLREEVKRAGEIGPDEGR